VPLFSRRLRPVPLERPDIEALVFPDHEPLRKRRPAEEGGLIRRSHFLRRVRSTATKKADSTA
jgi:hypothetical protein